MRPFDRIDRITDKLNQLWKLVPDFRFMQLIINMVGTGDNFYLEDTKFEQILDYYISLWAPKEEKSNE